MEIIKFLSKLRGFRGIAIIGALLIVFFSSSLMVGKAQEQEFVDISKFKLNSETTINAAFKRAVFYAKLLGHTDLRLPAGTWYVDSTGSSSDTWYNPIGSSSDKNAGLVIPSNFNLYLADDCVIQSIATSKANYRIINIQSVENVNVFGGTIKGDRNEHIANTGEWGNGIVIKDSKNINIYGTKIVDCWGDGVYLGVGSEKVFLHNIYSSNNRRNNLSLISCKVFRAKNCVFNNANGTLPMAGVDVEPNDGTSDLEDIKFIDCVFRGNERGFAVNVVRMKDTRKNIDVEFRRPLVENSQLGITVRTTSGITGQIKITMPTIREINGRGIWLIDPVVGGAKTILYQPIIEKCQKGRTTEKDVRIFGAITAFCNTDTITEQLGNVAIIEPYIDSPNSLSSISFTDMRTKPQKLKNIKIIKPKALNSAYDVSLKKSAYYKNRYFIDGYKDNSQDEVNKDIIIK